MHGSGDCPLLFWVLYLLAHGSWWQLVTWVIILNRDLMPPTSQRSLVPLSHQVPFFTWKKLQKQKPKKRHHQKQPSIHILTTGSLEEMFNQFVSPQCWRRWELQNSVLGCFMKVVLMSQGLPVRHTTSRCERVICSLTLGRFGLYKEGLYYLVMLVDFLWKPWKNDLIMNQLYRTLSYVTKMLKTAHVVMGRGKSLAVFPWFLFYHWKWLKKLIRDNYKWVHDKISKHCQLKTVWVSSVVGGILY